ncbi:ClpS-like protein [Fragilariopsis cylindrus CCMP1102]|uniref:ClpS-like protein n=1 Tax=Fragilariopsis cylindrus CCMP1102 TaxID=635003 RepID=A0A1E7FPC9_9STRA|nr:ClpS-like protein [Fragilariopsis cylindrus CCMP1102]|eukprot:OEU19663.1 ClpS-like protein [Fragilariopsis cylindrus CCMP1102]
MSTASYSYFCRAAFRSGGSSSVGGGAFKGRINTVATTAIIRRHSPTTIPTIATTNRYFSSDTAAAAAAVTKKSSETNVDLSSPKLQGLYDRVVKLPEEDVNVLGAVVLQVLGRTIFPGQFGTAGGGGGGGDGDAAVVEAEVVEEKTIFDLKLLGFDAKSKIKVIKEVRAIAGLGLKEAKTLVESAPKIIQKDIKKEKADELKEKLEALGAEIEIV